MIFLMCWRKNWKLESQVIRVSRICFSCYPGKIHQDLSILTALSNPSTCMFGSGYLFIYHQRSQWFWLHFPCSCQRLSRVCLFQSSSGCIWVKVGAPSLAVSGCSLAGTRKLLDPSGREELGGAEEVLQLSV